MRILSTTFASLLLAAACAGSPSHGTSTGGASTGGPTGLLAGAACASNQACASGACDVHGVGHCCAKACTASDEACQAGACDDTGACDYPAPGASCGAVSCSLGLALNGRCDGAGTCAVSGTPCPGNLGCDDAGASCNTACGSSADCAPGFACNAGACVAPIEVGACTENPDCRSGICGVNGTGHCCWAACPILGAPCGATDCEADSGTCAYPGSAVACSSVLASCLDGVEQPPSVCDGLGGCPTPATRTCDPFVCGPTACTTSCAFTGDCLQIDGNFCDAAAASCCNRLPYGSTLRVDSVLGSDATPCCGFGGAGPCQTIGRAMKLIDLTGAGSSTIAARVDGGGGDWLVPGEVYPIVLWDGAELNAPGVYFFDPDGGQAEIFDIAPLSPFDAFSNSAAIVNAAGIGMDSLGRQSGDRSAIAVEPGGALFLANTSVNGSAAQRTTAITVAAGGMLFFGADPLGEVEGAVTIGNGDGDPATAGWNGIVCGSEGDAGCSIEDFAFASVVIEGQLNLDLDAEDFAQIALIGGPVIGSPPASSGFRTCAAKLDASASSGSGVLLHGNAVVAFDGGLVQCLARDGFDLTASSNGTPVLTLFGTTIQNTERAVHASAGTVAISDSTVQFNHDGVVQDTDGTNVAGIDLSGDGSDTTNTVVCSSARESVLDGGGAVPGVCVLNTTSGALNASNVLWDTAGPDLFSCDQNLAGCSCQIGSCSAAPGADGMDAVTESSGIIATAGNQLSTIDCASP